MTKEEIKALRDELGLTQTAFAKRLGVTFQTVNRWENGKRSPTGLYLTALERLQKRIQKKEWPPLCYEHSESLITA